MGTAKPIELIEPCPFEIKDTKDKVILKYLHDLEINHPVVIGYNSLEERKKSAIRFQQRLADNRIKKGLPK